MRYLSMNKKMKKKMMKMMKKMKMMKMMKIKIKIKKAFKELEQLFSTHKML